MKDVLWSFAELLKKLRTSRKVIGYDVNDYGM